MDPQRFDSLAKRLGSRLTRRDALRAGAGVALGAVALSKIVPSRAQDPETTAKDRFISIRTYPYTGPISAAEAGLQELVSVMEQQAGFISIDFVDGTDAIHVVANFLDRSTAVAAAEQEDAWIEEYAQAILSGDPDIHSGDVFLRSELHAGCACTTGEDDACHSSRLVCCGTSAQDGGPGICLTTQTTCPATEGTPVAAVPTEAPTAEPEESACTSEGCACISGTDGACDEGLCCTGADLPGDEGTCTWDCGEGGCTSEGCDCDSGIEGSCDDGLSCCDVSDSGGAGSCQSVCG